MSTRTLLTDGTESDITPKELQSIEKFKEEGMPGLHAVVTNPVTITKALDLYLSGKTYHEVGQILTVKKDIVLYLAQKFDWYDTKMQHLEILDANLKERILHAKLVNQDFALQLQQFFLQKIGRKMKRFMATGDDAEAAKVNGADIDRYIKAVELLDKLTTEKNNTNGRGPAVGLNLGDGGVDIKRVNENEITITPRNKTVAQMLNELANEKRREENETKDPSYDISKNTDENKPERNEE